MDGAWWHPAEILISDLLMLYFCMLGLIRMAGINIPDLNKCCTLCINLFVCSHISILDGSHECDVDLDVFFD